MTFHTCTIRAAQRSARAPIVRDGFTPRGVGIMEPSITYRFSYPNTWPVWSTTPSCVELPMLHPPRGCGVIRLSFQKGEINGWPPVFCVSSLWVLMTALKTDSEFVMSQFKP